MNSVKNNWLIKQFGERLDKYRSFSLDKGGPSVKSIMKVKQRKLQKQTAALLIAECLESKQTQDCAVYIKYVKSSLCTCTSYAHMHLLA